MGRMALPLSMICRGFTLRIAAGITILVLLLAGGANALSDNESQAFLGLINNYRTQNNLGILGADASLQAAANWMSDDMLNNCVTTRSVCSHTDSTGRTFDKRLRDFGYPAGVSAAAGENLAWGYNGGMTTALQAFNVWKNSPGHNANMLGSSYTAIGISRSCNAGDCAWVTDFGSKVVQPANIDPTPSPTITQTPTPTITSIPTPSRTPVAAAGSISGYDVYDANGNGKWDTGEKGLTGWIIKVTGTAKDGGIINKETSTDSMGFYKFSYLPQGKYFVKEKVKKGFVPTGSRIMIIVLAAGENSINNNFTVVSRNN